jgi:hypothetical protein
MRGSIVLTVVSVVLASGTMFAAQADNAASKTISDRRPDMWLSANGGSGDDAEWVIGRDWRTQARRGLNDFYAPCLQDEHYYWTLY